MSRWKPRRRGRAPLAPAPALALLDLPDETPVDVRDLARTACKEAPRLLATFSPDEVGLVLIHPDSEACPDEHARRGRVFATVEPIAELEALARRLRLAARHRPGWFGCLLVGISDSGFAYLAPAERAAFERRAS